MVIETKRGVVSYIPSVKGVEGFVEAGKGKVSAEIDVGKKGSLGIVEVFREYAYELERVPDSKKTKWHKVIADTLASIMKHVSEDDKLRRVEINYSLKDLSGDSVKVIGRKQNPLVDNPRVIVKAGSGYVISTLGGVDGKDDVRPVLVLDNELFKRIRVSVALEYWPVSVVKKGIKTLFSTVVGVSDKGNFVIIPKPTTKFFSVRTILSKLDTINRGGKASRLGLLIRQTGKNRQEATLYRFDPKGLHRINPLWVVELVNGHIPDEPYILGDEKEAIRTAKMLFGDKVQFFY